MKAALFILVFVAVMAGTFFGSAGRLDLPLAWVCVGIYALFMVAAVLIMDPDLRRERMNPAPGGIDRHIRLTMFPFMLGFWVVAGLDIRWHGPDRLSVREQVLGLIGLAGSLCLALWAVSQNRFFSPVVRIQSERGHHLINTGPYRFIRHPGYLASISAALCGAIALGSWWALLPAFGCVAVILRRTILEDRFLHTELVGYATYARTVRYRLLPGIW